MSFHHGKVHCLGDTFDRDRRSLLAGRHSPETIRHHQNRAFLPGADDGGCILVRGVLGGAPGRVDGNLASGDDEELALEPILLEKEPSFVGVQSMAQSHPRDSKCSLKCVAVGKRFRIRGRLLPRMIPLIRFDCVA